MRFGRFVILTLIITATFALTMTFAPWIPPAWQIVIRAGLLAASGGFWLVCRRSSALAPWKSVAFAVFAAVFGLSLAWYAGDPIMAWLHIAGDTPMAVAISKFTQMVLTVAAILAVTAVAREPLRSLYLCKGRLLLGLGLGFSGFLLFLVITFVPGGPFFAAASSAGGLAKLWPLLPWAALFVASNAFFKEVLFRGLFLGRSEALTNQWFALFATTIAFALAHVQVNYAANVAGFVAFVFVLGLAWGYLMQTSRSIWGSVLFHAGADVAVILPIMQQMVC